MNVLVTGGAGYIGSLTCVSLIESGYTPVILDNLSNSKLAAVEAIGSLTGKTPECHVGDIGDIALMVELLRSRKIESVIHFAGKKAVSESVSKPLDYYRNNVTGTLNLLAAMQEAGVRDFIFSSSATVYGEPKQMPVTENSPRSAVSPYGRTKLMIEHILEDLARAEPDWSLTILRYFNPVGAHPSGRIGEDSQGVPNNLMPYLAQVAVGRRDYLPIFGGDYPTPDGTAVRDYVHVLDVAEGHVAALRTHKGQVGVHTYNLGTGQGRSVLELFTAFSHACGRNLPSRLVERRPGDIAAIWAEISKAERQLNWRARRSLDEMCQDTWRWQSANPDGYRA
ncbi:UDP-glucose 4-epimerase [Labrys miyagiensis]|uniref:UDP-glucose 4-epimerase n=1 Tax=Labrys miyagiensis TaxID=346912 RepID=A0ABQ6CML0_9HYPH|nr:UDP-glucose 4-epimerase GalE [Labrys miyagiensis]GLS19949.1 UDP-glucose 4-epimerase [Labrys miyagiensis]